MALPPSSFALKKFSRLLIGLEKCISISPFSEIERVSF